MQPNPLIKLIDLEKQTELVQVAVQERISKICEKQSYILGPEVAELEKALAAYTQSPYAITCGNGTDALQLVLMSLGLNPQKDVVLVPSFTFAASAEVVLLLGLPLAFVDIDLASFNISPEEVEKTLISLKKSGLNPAVLIGVDLFGLACDHEALQEICNNEKMFYLVDAAQSFGAKYNGQSSLSFGDAATTSFFPAKPLGCFGDGGAIFTKNPHLQERLKSLRNHGMGKDRYSYEHIGINSRLDSFQAAVLLEKLRIFPQEVQKRQEIAAFYKKHLQGKFSLQQIPAHKQCIFAQYSMLTKSREDRTGLQDKLRSANIQSQIYYPIPVHQQRAYRQALVPESGLPNTLEACERIMSIPMHPYLSEQELQRVVDCLL